MHSFSRALLATATLFLSVTGIAAAQTPSAFSRQMSRVDFGINGVGQLTNTVTGPIIPTGASNYGTVMSQYASNTVGASANIRYIAKPYIGVEFNYVWGRYTENYSPSPATGSGLFQIQTTSNEYSFGWIVTPPHPIFGMQPFISAGAGTNQFKPTGGGGNGAPHQFRATYYYNVGAQKDITSNIGLRASFRQTFYLAPDYGQNYLTILKHATTLQPTAGFYVRF